MFAVLLPSLALQELPFGLGGWAEGVPVIHLESAVAGLEEITVFYDTMHGEYLSDRIERRWHRWDGEE